MKLRWLPVFLLSLALPLFGQQKSILFDAMHAQTAGNADWTLDEDSCGIAQRFPTPDQAGITSSTPETYWNGAHSAMGVDLVKKGFHVESLPVGARISYNDGTNDVNGACPLPLGTNSSGTYSLSIAFDTTAGMAAGQSYTLTATALGSQALDTHCGNFLLNQVNQQSVSTAATDCW